MKKVLLDTDIGSDIDDALALAYLLKEPECKLMGITTVSGQSDIRAQMVDAICRNAGIYGMPIYRGVEQPLMSNQRQSVAKQSDRLDGWDFRKDFLKASQFEAIEFMRRTIRENPHEISLLAVGPMTNIALLFALDREIPSLLKELVIMCGDFLREGITSEWNSRCDPVASAIVYSSKVAVHKSVGLNVTTKVKMDRAEMEKCFVSKIMEPVKAFAYTWFEQAKYMVYHDPLAAMVLFDDNICTFKKGDATVRLPQSDCPGKIDFTENSQGSIEVADSVNVEYALQKYLDTVNR